MTKKDIVKQCADSFAEGVAIAMKGTMIESYILEGLIAQTYIKAFEAGIVFKTWGQMPNEFYTLATDADFYDDYTKTQLKEVTEK